ncbi:MAG: NAD(P)H-dependent oxidoreductase [Armatimonadota bacterium]|nr:NAD(P)H-dependent oxidoreductase [Armatimonadota bacterium]
MARIAVVYYSKTGNTERMAELIAEGCREVPGVEVEVVKLPGVDMDRLQEADGYAIGSPDYFSYMAGHVKTLYDEALSLKEQLSGRPYVAFCTHGGGGRALESLERLSQALGLEQVAPGELCAGAPSGESEERARRLGRRLAEAVAGG